MFVAQIPGKKVMCTFSCQDILLRNDTHRLLFMIPIDAKYLRARGAGLGQRVEPPRWQRIDAYFIANSLSGRKSLSSQVFRSDLLAQFTALVPSGEML